MGMFPMAKLCAHTFQEVREVRAPRGRRVEVSRDIELSLSTVMGENQLSGPHANIHWQSLSGAVLR